MERPLKRHMRRFAVVLLTAAFNADASGVRVLFDPVNPDTGPFPTDFLTVPDERQKTNRRIQMPLPDCNAKPADCAELSHINQLDGFSLIPRVTVRFSGPVDPNSIRNGIFIYWLDRYNNEENGLGPNGKITGVNQVVYEPQTQTIYAKSDDVLDQSRRYLLVITDRVRDASGSPVEPDGGFRLCLNRQIGGAYCGELAAAVDRASRDFSGQQIVGAALFTTLSATAWLESARQSLLLSDTSFERAGIFAANDISTIALRRHRRGTGDRFDNSQLPLALLVRSGLGRLAFGSIRSPRVLNRLQFIPHQPTRTRVELSDGPEQIHFHAWLPALPPPMSGYPVVIAGHGLTDDRFGMPTALAATFLRAGYAIVAINAANHGFGPDGTVEISLRNGESASAPYGGRSMDVDGNGMIDAGEGAILISPDAPFFIRDTLRQTALDLMQLTRAIRSGMDLDGDGVPDLNGSDIGYVGQSLGGFYGTLFHAVEPDIHSAVINVAGGTATDAARWSPSFAPILSSLLRLRGLQNRPGSFNGNYVLRHRPPVVNDVPGAIAIQNELERLEWLEMPGSPVAYAPHLKSSTLPGVPIKRTLFQFALGDRVVTNPSNALLLRAANEWETASVYRHDLARAVVPQLPADPHTHLAWVLNPAGMTIALAAQAQSVSFLQGSNNLFEVNGPIGEQFGGRMLFEPAPLILENVNLTGP